MLFEDYKVTKEELINNILLKVKYIDMEVCKYQKFGFCKFKGTCKNQHLVEICENLTACENVKSCHKRHPRVCKKFALQKVCSFGADCAYQHQEENGYNQIKIKVIELENIVTEMSKKISQLESKLQKSTENNVPEKLS